MHVWAITGLLLFWMHLPGDAVIVHICRSSVDPVVVPPTH
jgi:hypothetical protein